MRQQNTQQLRDATRRGAGLGAVHQQCRHRQARQRLAAPGRGERRIEVVRHAADAAHHDRLLRGIEIAPGAVTAPVVDEQCGGVGKLAAHDALAHGSRNGLDLVQRLVARREPLDHPERDRLVQRERLDPLRMAQRDLHRDHRTIRMRDQVDAGLGMHARDHGLRVDQQRAAGGFGPVGPVGAAAMAVQVEAGDAAMPRELARQAAPLGVAAGARMQAHDRGAGLPFGAGEQPGEFETHAISIDVDHDGAELEGRRYRRRFSALRAVLRARCSCCARQFVEPSFQPPPSTL
jgi:hypothetical protein